MSKDTYHVLLSCIEYAWHDVEVGSLSNCREIWTEGTAIPVNRHAGNRSAPMI